MIEKEGREYEIIKAFQDEFKFGTETKQLLDQNRPMVQKIEQVMKENYNWTDQIPPIWLGAHECSDMILSAGNMSFLIAVCPTLIFRLKPLGFMAQKT
jgi:hypothetical protein